MIPRKENFRGNLLFHSICNIACRNMGEKKRMGFCFFNTTKVAFSSHLTHHKWMCTEITTLFM